MKFFVRLMSNSSVSYNDPLMFATSHLVDKSWSSRNSHEYRKLLLFELHGFTTWSDQRVENLFAWSAWHWLFLSVWHWAQAMASRELIGRAPKIDLSAIHSHALATDAHNPKRLAPIYSCVNFLFFSYRVKPAGSNSLPINFSSQGALKEVSLQK